MSRYLTALHAYSIVLVWSYWCACNLKRVTQELSCCRSMTAGLFHFWLLLVQVQSFALLAAITP